MTTLNRFDVAIALYPFIDRGVSKPRPCLVLSTPKFQADEGAVIAAMITTAGRSGWPSDVLIADLAAAGLSRPSVIRWKMFTLDVRILAGRAGALARADAAKAEKGLGAVLGISA